jgi:hypothetical protein
MADVNVSVNVDGKTVFVCGASSAPDVIRAAMDGINAALWHFQRIDKAISQQSGAPQQTSATTTKGPTL